MDFQMIPVSERLEVEGRSEREAIGEFAGRVIAVAFRGGDPVGDPVGDLAAGEVDSTSAPEGLGGWGTTYFLVADDDHPAPIWVPKEDVAKTRLR